VISSELVRIRNFKLQDVNTFLKYRNNPITARFQSWKANMTHKEATIFVISESTASFLRYDEGLWHQFAIDRLDSEQHIGDFGVCIKDDQYHNVEFGITLMEQHQGLGFATDAAKLLLSYLFNERNVHRIYAITDFENYKSIKLMERLEMRREGHFIKNFYEEKTKEWRDEYLYAALKAHS